MPLVTSLCVSGYRTLRDVRLALGELGVVTGPNGSGKSNLYRALRLLADVAQGRIIPSLAMEGGLASVLWAGPEAIARAVRQGREPVQGTLRQHKVSLKLGFASQDLGYAIDLGLPSGGSRWFSRDPEIKMESLWTGPMWRLATMFAERHGPAARVRSDGGGWKDETRALASYDSMLTQCADTGGALDLLLLRENLRSWRFYDQFRTDAEAPARRAQVGTRTAALAADGADLAAAIATIIEIGAEDELSAAIEDAFPGAGIDVVERDGYLALEMRQRGLLRPLRASEVSDGTLRYLLLIAALLTPRPPPLMVFNEPETSLHPVLIAPLARLLAQAAKRSQILVVSHSQSLVRGLTSMGATLVTLAKEFGETVVEAHERPPWTWPMR